MLVQLIVDKVYTGTDSSFEISLKICTKKKSLKVFYVSFLWLPIVNHENLGPKRYGQLTFTVTVLVPRKPTCTFRETAITSLCVKTILISTN